MYCQRRSNNLINRIHEIALRIAYNDYVSDFSSLLDKDDTVTIHQRNIHASALEIYKTINNLNPNFMDEIFSVKQNNYPTRNQNLVYPNPRTVTYGLETLGYKACQIWNSIPQEIKIAKDIATFKSSIPKHNENICKCNLCKLYITNLGYLNT